VSEQQEEAALDAELRRQLGDERVHLADHIQLGLEMESFLDKNKAAQYLVARAQSAIEDGNAAFLNATNLSDEKLAKLHFEARVAATLILWMNEAIDNGRAAAKQIQTQEELDSHPITGEDSYDE